LRKFSTHGPLSDTPGQVIEGGEEGGVGGRKVSSTQSYSSSSSSSSSSSFALWTTSTYPPYPSIGSLVLLLFPTHLPLNAWTAVEQDRAVAIPWE